MHQHPLTIEVRPSAGSITFALVGELDLSSCTTLRTCLEELDPGVTDVAVDLTGLSFIDSSGLALLVTTQQALAGRGGSMALLGANGHVRRVLEVSGVDQVLTVQV